MKNAVDNCTKHSLVLVDEFGKGTETRDGASASGEMSLRTGDDKRKEGKKHHNKTPKM